MSLQYGGSWATPGQTTLRETVEKAPLASSFFLGDVKMAEVPLIKSDSTDAGSSPTTTLRPGLLMAQLDADGQWVPYDSDAIGTGAQEARGVLVAEVNMLDYGTGAGAQRFKDVIVVKGNARVAGMLNLDAAARGHLKARGWTFDDEDTNPSVAFPFRVVREVVADTTVVAADNGVLFVSTKPAAAVTFTLPTKANGLRFSFMQTVDQNMVIASAGSADDIISLGDAGADTVTYSTASNKIGAVTTLLCTYVNGSLKWLDLTTGGTRTVA